MTGAGRPQIGHRSPTLLADGCDSGPAGHLLTVREVEGPDGLLPANWADPTYRIVLEGLLPIVSGASALFVRHVASALITMELEAE